MFVKFCDTIFKPSTVQYVQIEQNGNHCCLKLTVSSPNIGIVPLYLYNDTNKRNVLNKLDEIHDILKSHSTSLD